MLLIVILYCKYLVAIFSGLDEDCFLSGESALKDNHDSAVFKAKTTFKHESALIEITYPSLISLLCNNWFNFVYNLAIVDAVG